MNVCEQSVYCKRSAKVHPTLWASGSTRVVWGGGRSPSADSQPGREWSCGPKPKLLTSEVGPEGPKAGPLRLFCFRVEKASLLELQPLSISLCLPLPRILAQRNPTKIASEPSAPHASLTAILPGGRRLPGEGLCSKVSFIINPPEGVVITSLTYSTMFQRICSSIFLHLYPSISVCLRLASAIPSISHPEFFAGLLHSC